MPASGCRGRTSLALVTPEVTEPAGRMVHAQHVQHSGIGVKLPVPVVADSLLSQLRMPPLIRVQAACPHISHSSGTVSLCRVQKKRLAKYIDRTAVGSKRADAPVACPPYASPARSTLLLACQVTAQQIQTLGNYKQAVPLRWRARSQLVPGLLHRAQQPRPLVALQKRGGSSQLEFSSRGATIA